MSELQSGPTTGPTPTSSTVHPPIAPIAFDPILAASPPANAEVTPPVINMAPGVSLTPGIDVSTPMPPPPPAPPGMSPPVPPAPVPVAPVPVEMPVEPVVAGGMGGSSGLAEAPLDGPAPRRRGVLVAAGAVALVGLVGAASFAVSGGDAGSEEQSVTTAAAIVEEAIAPAADPVVIDDGVELENDAVVADEAPAPIDDGVSDQAAAADVDAEQDTDVEQDANSNVAEPAVSGEPVAADPDDATVAEANDDSAANSVDEADEPASAEPAATSPEVDASESVATVRNGQIFLEGAVPTQEAGDELAALAAEVLGADNVFNTYVVDPNAGDPDIGNITVEDTINFGTDSAVLLDPDNPLLAQGVALMTIRPAMTITIVGHTDSRGSNEANETLSLERAEAVKAFFVDNGVDPDRLTTEGAGASEPIASNDTAAGRSENRRIQFFLENILGEA